jgi:sugar phosphate isomerase/epimerase
MQPEQQQALKAHLQAIAKILYDGTEANPSFQHPDVASDRNTTVNALNLFLEIMTHRGIRFVSLSSAF